MIDNRFIEDRDKMSLQLRIIIFLISSFGIIWVSRSSLRNYLSHGFYRFFAWEAILILILLNINQWFQDPLSTNQIISWFLLMISLFLVIHGAYLLQVIGKPDKERNESSLIGIEKTTQLVKIGAYRYIRHPIYSSLLFLTWGTFFKDVSWEGIFLSLMATLCLGLTAKFEEIENIIFFGEEYRKYMEETKRFIQYIF